MYENMYHQRLHEPDPRKWRCKVEAWREVIGHSKLPDGRLQLSLKNTSNGEASKSDLSFDLVVVGTGYERNAHETLLAPTRDLLPSDRFVVGRNYKIQYREGAVADDSGIWLQGCCEDSHGLSDTLLSILAVRGGEMVDSIFPAPRQAKL
ncbi:hypothetical protein N7G274_008138 [Stereocaulon virgatum]|uniref:L-ornithine N(5)-monooxygenase [NAD(P)H] n=1 Tax=Stereocaulon virgatum TaxID=373712 RepID=A0ABR3ZZH2_9LECA